MRFRKVSRCSLICIALLTTACQRSGEYEISGQKILIPSPGKLVPISGKAPSHLRSDDPSNVTLEAYLTPSDLGDLMADRSKSRERSCSAWVPKAFFNRSDFGPSEFAATAEAIRREVPSVGQEGMAHQNKRNASVSQATGRNQVLLSNVESLDVFLDESNAIARGHTEDAEVAGVTTHHAAATATLRVKNHILQITCQTVVRGEDDVSWMKGTVTSWARSILAENRS